MRGGIEGVLVTRRVDYGNNMVLTLEEKSVTILVSELDEVSMPALLTDLPSHRKEVGFHISHQGP